MILAVDHALVFQELGFVSLNCQAILDFLFLTSILQLRTYSNSII